MKDNFQKILAMDLSLNLPAFCVAVVENGVFRVIEVSHVDNKKNKNLTTAEKLGKIANHIRDLIRKHGEFDIVVREKGFSRYANTTQVLFRVVGVSDLIMHDELNIKEMEEIPPTTIKTMIAGYSRADKQEVEEGVRDLLQQDQKNMKFYSDDESDAVAVALTSCIKRGLLN